MIRTLSLLILLVVPALAVRAAPPAVVELFEDDADALIAQLTMGGLGGGETVSAVAEKADVFTGKSALRVSAMQRFNSAVRIGISRLRRSRKRGSTATFASRGRRSATGR